VGVADVLLAFLTNLFVSRDNPFLLLVALDSSQSASGLLFLDDGESTGTFFKD